MPEGNEFQQLADTEQRRVQATQIGVILENSKKTLEIVEGLAKTVKTQSEQIKDLKDQVKALKKK